MQVACFFLPQLSIVCTRISFPYLKGAAFVLTDARYCLQAVSEEAREHGIETGMTVTAARALCESLSVLPYDLPAYELAARPLWDLLATESSCVEPDGPELCYAEFTGREITSRVRWLTERLAQTIRTPLRVGLGRSRFVARKAAQSGSGALTVVPVGQEAALLAPTPLADIPRIDLRMRQRLERLGVRTLGEALALPGQERTRRLRSVGLLLERLATGIDGEPVRPLWPPQEAECSLEFDDPVCALPAVQEALRRCAEQIGQTLTERRVFCRALLLQVTLADETLLQEHGRLRHAADWPEDILTAALRLLGRMPLKAPLRAIRLAAQDLGAGSGVQLTLLDQNSAGQGLPHERRNRLEAALVSLRKRYGAGAVVTAGMLCRTERLRYWTHPLARRCDMPVQVATGSDGAPLRYWYRDSSRADQRREVRRIQDRWRETEWRRESLIEKTVYRVETEPGGVYELHQMGSHWRLGGMAD